MVPFRGSWNRASGLAVAIALADVLLMVLALVWILAQGAGWTVGVDPGHHPAPGLP